MPFDYFNRPAATGDVRRDVPAPLTGVFFLALWDEQREASPDAWPDAFANATGTSDSIVLATNEAPTEPLSLVAQLAAIKAAFGLSLSALAEILQVSRTTLYSWLDESGGVRLHRKNVERIADLCELAALWNSMCDLPLPAELADQLLKVRILKSEQTEKLMRATAQTVLNGARQMQPSFGQQLLDKGFPSHLDDALSAADYLVF